MVRNAPDEEKVATLIRAMATENNKSMDDLEPEFCSWALSCMSELSAGNADNRAAILKDGGLDLLFDFMKKFPQDVSGLCLETANIICLLFSTAGLNFRHAQIFTQWQGSDALGRLGEDIRASSGAYEGQPYMEKAVDVVMTCLMQTDISELGLTGTRALTNMAKASGTCVRAFRSKCACISRAWWC